MAKPPPNYRDQNGCWNCNNVVGMVESEEGPMRWFHQDYSTRIFAFSQEFPVAPWGMCDDHEPVEDD